LLTSTSSTEPAKSESPENDNYTAFTHELLTILEQGIEGAGEILTIQDIFSGLREQLKSKDLPLPLITSYGSPNELRICKNLAYQNIFLTPDNCSTKASSKHLFFSSQTASHATQFSQTQVEQVTQIEPPGSIKTFKF
jgi:hypothetical protein